MSIGGLRIAAWLALGILLAQLAGIEVYRLASADLLASDFRSTLWEPARAVVNGVSPYGLGDLAGSVYPPSSFVPLVWLGALPFPAAATAWIVVSLAAAFATLWVLDVRDWRCYLLWMLNAVTLSTALTGNATTLVVLLVALMWRFRDVAGGAGAALAAAIAIKLFAAPLVLWLALTRRYRAAAYAVVGSVVAVVGAWSVIGFDGLTGYLDVLDRNNATYSADGPFLQGLLQQWGVDRSVAFATGIAAGLVFLGGAWLVRHDQMRSLVLVLTAVIIVPPVAWVGYATLLVVPLAVRSPRFGPWWLLLAGFAYVHWWHSPLTFRSAGLSLATLALTAGLVVGGLGLARWRSSALEARDERREVALLDRSV